MPHRYVNIYKEALKDPYYPPELEFQFLEMRCHRCGAYTKIPIQTDLIDWRVVAEDYRQVLAAFRRDMDRMMETIDVMSADNPIRQFMRNEYAFIKSEINRMTLAMGETDEN